MVTELLKRGAESVDSAGVGFFRATFGALMLFSTIRYWWNGWIVQILTEPEYHFSYWGFSWVRPLSEAGMNCVFILMAISALCICIGLRVRLFSAVFFVSFSYVELIEKAAYLNHYYLISLISFLFILLPTSGAFSIKGVRYNVQRWVYIVLRAQVGLVYFYAGVAKIGTDWLLHGQPLRTWLQAYRHWEMVGEILCEPMVAILMSWAGMLFDLTIVGWLMWSKSRRLAYSVLLVFHFAIWVLFPIGVFSWVMMVAATIFFRPSWCGRGVLPEGSFQSIPYLVRWIVCPFLLLQIALPLRHLLYPGAVNWTEEGFRFSWRVMLIEKAGHLEYRIRTNERTTELIYSPREDLTPLQYKMISTQPDMILQYAHHLEKKYIQLGFTGIEIYARSNIWFNGYASQAYIDPEVDLLNEKDDLSHKEWILPRLTTE